MAENEYKRLTRTTARGPLGITRASLWLGSDHLLCVETTGYSEIYKRFYFRDIEAIVVRGTTTRNVWTMVLGIAVFLFLVFCLVASEPAARVTYICLTALCALALIINLVRGPTCTCEIRTLVQTEKLPLSRIRKVRKFLDRVRPLIASAQGQLTPEEVTARFSEPPLATPAPAASTIASETPNVATAFSLSSPNEDLSRLGSGERNSAEGEGPRGSSEREQASQRAGERSLRVQGEISQSPSADDPNAPPPAAS